MKPTAFHGETSRGKDTCSMLAANATVKLDQYVTDLKTKPQTCEFGELKDSLIRDRIVCGIHCDKTGSRLLREPDLTLQKAVDICRANETTSSQMKSFTSDQTNDLPAIHGIRSQTKQVQKLYCD